MYSIFCASTFRRVDFYTFSFCFNVCGHASLVVVLSFPPVWLRQLIVPASFPTIPACSDARKDGAHACNVGGQLHGIRVVGSFSISVESRWNSRMGKRGPSLLDPNPALWFTVYQSQPENRSEFYHGRLLSLGSVASELRACEGSALAVFRIVYGVMILLPMGLVGPSHPKNKES
ncbi:hypothetical protein M432DRAFT_404126 [Thermoascus aurantiacus ATCC 26904]